MISQSFTPVRALSPEAPHLTATALPSLILLTFTLSQSSTQLEASTSQKFCVASPIGKSQYLQFSIMVITTPSQNPQRVT